MLRVLTSLIRNAPGPLKGARAMTADLLEGVIDVVRPPTEVEQTAPPVEEVKSSPTPPKQEEAEEIPRGAAAEREEPQATDTPAEESSAPEANEEATEEPASAEPRAAEAPPPVEEADPGESAPDPEPRELSAAFREALNQPKWVRRQDFKVLAIFWESRERAMGPITAKTAAGLGEELGLKIRHENIRKVVRTRLDEKIEASTIAESQPPTFQYEITEAGLKFFRSEYLEKV